MPTKKPKHHEQVHYHRDGVRMRSGCFETGEQIGQWTTYDKAGAGYKVTTMKPKAK